MLPAVNSSNAELLLAAMRLPVPLNKIATQLRGGTDIRGILWLGCHCSFHQGSGDRHGNKWAEELLKANNIAFDILNSDRTPTDDDILEDIKSIDAAVFSGSAKVLQKRLRRL
jgi:hypothetical protein